MLLPLDDATAGRLLAGEVPTQDAPPGLGRLAELIQAAHAPAGPDELASTAHVAAFCSTVRFERRTARSARSRTIVSRLVAATSLATLMGATAAMASTGSLPDVLSRVGVGGTAATTHPGRTVPPAPSASSVVGQCTAFLAASKQGEQSSAFQALIAVHGGTVNSTTSFCKEVTATRQ
jgi:hypothetical protein